MPSADLSHAPLSLTDAARLFRRWRASRKLGERIPTALWTVACAAVAQHGVSRVSSALGLDYYSVKRRSEKASVAPSPPVRKKTPDRAPAFVEIPMPTPPSGIACAVEIEHIDDRASRTKLRIELPAITAEDLAALLHALRAPR